MKKHRFINIFLLAIFLTMSSCERQESVITQYNTPDLSDGSYLLSYDEENIYPSDGRIYAVTAEDGGKKMLGYYDTALNMRHTEIAEISAAALFVREDEIHVLSEDNLLVLNQSGEVIQSFGVYEDIADEWLDSKLYASEETIAAARIGKNSGLVFSVVHRKDDSIETSSVQADYAIHSVYHIEKTGRNTYLLLCSYADEMDMLVNGLFSYRTDNDKMELLSVYDGSLGYDRLGDSVYTINPDLSVLQLMKISDDGENVEFLRNIGMDVCIEQIKKDCDVDMTGFRCDKLFFTGDAYLIWDEKNHIVSVYALHETEDGNTLTVLYPVDGEMNSVTGELDATAFTDVDYDMLTFENQEKCAIRAKTYSVEEFTDRLRMKLLAGEDDFDIVYADRCERGDILSAILRYQLYLPLENYPQITEHLTNLAYGVAEFMTCDEHLIGCPYQFGGTAFVVNPAFYDTDLTLPEVDWTLDDFYGLCEAAIPYCMEKDGVTTALACLPEQWLISSIIQNGYDTGSVSREEIENAVEKIAYYTEIGVFASYRDADVILLETVNIPVQGSVSHDRGTGKILPLPTVQGKRYAPLNSFVFVNRNTTNPDLSADYIAMLLSDNFVSKVGKRKTHFAKDTDSYFSLVWGDAFSIGFSGGEKLEINKWNRSSAKFDESEQYYLSAANEIFPGTSVYTIDSPSSLNEGGTWETVRNVFSRIMAGEITAEQGAEEIYTYACARYME